MAIPAITITVSQNGTAVLMKLDRALDAGKLRTALFHFFRELAKRAQDFTRTYTFTKTRLHIRHGDLLRAIQGTSRIVQGVPQFRVGIFRGHALKYAGIQEYGTKDLNPYSPYNVIRPRRRRALAIPAPGGDAVDAQGTPLYKSPRHYEINTGDFMKLVPYNNGGNVIGGLYNLKDLQMIRKEHMTLRNIRAVYLLLRKASLPPAHYLRDSMRQFLPLVGEEIAEHLRLRFR